MSGRRAQRPRSTAMLSVVDVPDEATSRALVQVTDAVQKLQGARERAVVTVSLVIGTNKIRHGLGRPVLGYTITPTFATIAFGHALNETNPHPEREIWIDVVGSDQDDARVEVF